MMNIKLNKKMSLENHINSIFKQLDQNDDNTITRCQKNLSEYFKEII